jgi:RimK family alpha-L-glutamate ligase
MRARRRVAIFSADPDWHAKRLIAALAARGVDGVCVALEACYFDIEGGRAGLRLPGFEEALPDGAITRLISAGSLEEITLRLGVLRALEQLGVPVYNDARAVENTVDKSMTSFLLERSGLPTPPTWAVQSRELACRIAERELAAGGKLVLKPLFGSQGKGVLLIDAPGRLPEPEEAGGVYYLQRFVDTGTGGWHDWRILVVGERAIAAMIRRGRGWITNVFQGATCEAAAAEGELAELAIAATKAVGAAYAGVDLMRGRDGRFVILEVNSIPAWKGLQGVARIDIAQTLVDHFLSRLSAAGPAAAAV